MFDSDPIGDGLFAPSGCDLERSNEGAVVGSEADLVDQVSRFRETQQVDPGGRKGLSSGTILLPYSGSESAEFAVDAAIQLFSGSACEVRVVHFREWIASRAGPSFLLTQAQARRLVAHAALRLGRSGLTASAVVWDSNRSMVPTRIIGEAEDIRAEAIVLGARRRRPVTAAILGSVSLRVARQSMRPVVLVHPPDAHHRPGATGAPGPGTPPPLRPHGSRAA